MSDRQICVGCQAQSPETETNYTLIGSQHGWRLIRTRAPDGTVVAEWRCPGCWKAYKASLSKGGEGQPPSSRTGMLAVDPPSGTHAVGSPVAGSGEHTRADTTKSHRRSSPPPPRRSKGR
jgi:hypothetical protein